MHCDGAEEGCSQLVVLLEKEQRESDMVDVCEVTAQVVLARNGTRYINLSSRE